MRYVRVGSPEGPRWGVVEGDHFRLIEGGLFGEWRASGPLHPLANAVLLAPWEGTKIVAIGLNYRAHAAETGVEVPKEPAMFLKPPSSVVGPGRPIVRPRRSARVDYEAELACVIAARASQVAETDALRYVLGYTCLNDVTARDIQLEGGHFLNLTWAKGYDTFCPIGPCITDEIDPDDVLVEGYLNGRRVQSSSTRDFIFSMAHIVAWVSRVMTLYPGDVISTGTPVGVGPVEPGDVIEVRVAGVGGLSNPVAAEPGGRVTP